MTFWSPKARNFWPRVSKGFPLLIFFLLCAIGHGQDSPSKLLKGKVTSPSGDVMGVTIQNSTARRATITDFDGNFSIQVSEGDTLVFSAIQFKRKVLPVSRALMGSPFLQIPMEEFVNELQEVTVKPFGLSGDIEKDLSGLQLDKDVSAEALGLPNAEVKIITQSERKLYEATTGAGIVPLNPILNAITGRTRMLKNRIKIDRKYERTLKVQRDFADSIFLAEFKIPKTKMDDFMYFCEVDDEFQRLVSERDQLKIWSYLLDRSKLYRKNNGLE